MQKLFRRFALKQKSKAEFTPVKRGQAACLTGFTLLEMVVSTAIILLVATISLASYRSGASANTLTRVATRVAQDLRRAQNLALASLPVGGQVPYGFGIYFSTSDPNHYYIFADQNDNHSFDWPGETYETVGIEPGTILTVSPFNPLQVVFNPPDPVTFINGVSSGAAFVRVYLPNIPGQCRDVVINSSGLVEIQNQGTC